VTAENLITVIKQDITSHTNMMSYQRFTSFCRSRYL